MGRARLKELYYITHILAIFALFISAGCAGRSAHEAMIPVSDEYHHLAIFGDSEVSGWRLARPVNTYDRKSIFDYIDGAAELYFAYNFRAVAAAEYQKAEASNAPETSIIIDVYDMTTPEDAFGIYSLNRYLGANYVDIGNEGILTGAALDFWKGKYFCKVYSLDMSEKRKNDVINFGSKLASRIQESGSEPSILERLPQSGLIPKTAKFFSMKLGLDNIHYVSEENVLNLNEETRGVVAEYQIDDTRFQLFIIAYPSLKQARSAFEAYSDYLCKKGELVLTSEGTLVKMDGKFTFVKIKDQTLSGFWDVETREATQLFYK